METINRQLNIREGGNTMGYQQDLYMENWDKDILGTSNVSKGNAVVYNASGCSSCSSASGEGYSNLYGTGKCKDACKSMFPDNKDLEKACKTRCSASCNYKESCKKDPSRIPTASDICKSHPNYNTDCTLKGVASGGVGSESVSSAPSKGGGNGGGSNTALWVVGGILLLGGIGFGAYKYFKK